MDSSQCQRTFALSLVFDGPSSDALSSLKREVSEIAGIKSQDDVPPHITLGMFHADAGRLDEVKKLFGDFMKDAPGAFRVDFSGPGFFMDKVIFLSINKDAKSFGKIADLNQMAHRIFLPEFEAGGNRNYLPENFLPHVALATKLDAEGFLRAKDFCSSMTFPASARIAGASLFLCHPHEEIARAEFSGDTLTPEQRHKNMAAIRSIGGKLETALRSQLFRFGFRFRKNDRRLAGSPDVVFPHYHAVIFVNGCFWHAHDCDKFRLPRTNQAFWLKKFARNRERDRRDIALLLEQGWRVCVVWECSITGRNRRAKLYDTASKISLWLEEGFSEPFVEF